ncbi:MAG TPA: sigma-70 family RNA polymerase sigma factor [Pyrinomonadaceae bacterium]
MPEETTDERLLERARAGDEAAFLALYERHHAPAYRFALRLLGSEAPAEDAVHDCFLELVTRAGFDPARGSLRNYLFGAVRHRALRQFRRAGRECEIAEADGANGATNEALRVAASSEPLGLLLGAELSETVRTAVARLPPLQREALLLFEYEELSLAEVAEVVGADVNAVKARLFRARAGLRKSLAPYLLAGAEEALAAKD